MKRRSNVDRVSQLAGWSGLGNSINTATALAFMRAGRFDVRPDLLLTYFAQVQASIEPCVEYGRVALEAWCQRVGIGEAWGHAYESAASDGLALVYWGRATRGHGRPTIAERCLQLRMAPRDYSLLRNKAADIYRARLIEALERFHAVLSDTLERLTSADRHHGSVAIENATERRAA